MARTKQVPRVRTKQVPRGCFVKTKRFILRTLLYVADAIMAIVAKEASKAGVYKDEEAEYRSASNTLRTFFQMTGSIIEDYSEPAITLSCHKERIADELDKFDEAETSLSYLKEVMDARFEDAQLHLAYKQLNYKKALSLDPTSGDSDHDFARLY